MGTFVERLVRDSDSSEAYCGKLFSVYSRTPNHIPDRFPAQLPTRTRGRLALNEDAIALSYADHVDTGVRLLCEKATVASLLPKGCYDSFEE
jgi:hypothetical protein